ncbi:DUF4383 domain-containing protein [Salinibacterium sp. M195]|uniref:DUF4383 domain-containing protein n=1 Tax=Salinibacterium sp. M195 TaxID=2583374 RepID=UPI001C63603F|nr:DUF4383 domain-containing protein [Salinibacterium sp. M195]QYH34938.1 DUF4383 domain-containing protein [Salinibacterium sp. M195]
MTQSPNRLLGVVLGTVYILLGLLGFTVTNGVNFLATEGGLLVGILGLNGFHNVVHIVIGAALVLAGISNRQAARTANSTIGFAFLILGFAGLLLVGSSLNILALNAADNVLHFASAVVLLLVGLGADKRATGVSA